MFRVREVDVGGVETCAQLRVLYPHELFFYPHCIFFSPYLPRT